MRCVVLCAGTGWYVVLYCVPVPGGMLCCTVCRYRVCVVLYCVPVPGGMLCCTVCRYRVVCRVVLCAGTGWYVHTEMVQYADEVVKALQLRSS